MVWHWCKADDNMASLKTFRCLDARTFEVAELRVVTEAESRNVGPAWWLQMGGVSNVGKAKMTWKMNAPFH